MSGKETDQVDGLHHPKFHGPGDFLRSLGRVSRILVLGRHDGARVIRPWIEEKGWLTPRFREQLCLVVTIQNRCVG